MNFPFYIARRYIFAKKSHNAINIISLIAVIGVLVGTSAFIIILSVFNGFDDLVQSMYNSFYPDLQLIPSKGKTFVISDDEMKKLKSIEGVEEVAEILEDNVLIIYDDRQTVGTVRGVSDNYELVSGVDTMMYDGEFLLHQNNIPKAILGRSIAYYLGVNITFVEYLKLYVPKRSKKITFNPEKALNRKYITVSGIFATQPEIDAKYIIVPLSVSRELFQYAKDLTSLEIKLKSGYTSKEVKKNIESVFSNRFIIKDRFQQNEVFYKTMKSEKWAIFFILALVLIVASFNLIGSLSMLIIEKKDDIDTLKSLGTEKRRINSIFFIEGILIGTVGALIGLIIGIIICYLQQEFGFVKLHGGESFIIDAYPVKIEWPDIILVIITVSLIGIISSWYPVRAITKKFLLRQL